MNTRPTLFPGFRAGLAAGLLVLGVFTASGQDREIPVDPPAPPSPLVATQDLVRGYLQVQEQLHALQMSLESNQQDAQDIAARNVKALGERLNALEQSIGSQRVSELKAMQDSNHLMLLITGIVALLGFGVVVFGFLQWRAMHRLTEVAISLQARQQVGGRMSALIDASEPRLLGVIDRLEKRIRELEHGNRLPLTAGEAIVMENGGGNPENGSPAPIVAPVAAEKSAPGEPTFVRLNKGQSLLSLGQYEAALACFDEVLAAEPSNIEALIKKGTALEKLQKLNEAVACYDRAIETDQTVTIAYLYKGGVFNRLERYNEALECYEKALKTQEKAHAA